MKFNLNFTVSAANRGVFRFVTNSDTGVLDKSSNVPLIFKSSYAIIFECILHLIYIILNIQVDRVCHTGCPRIVTEIRLKYYFCPFFMHNIL